MPEENGMGLNVKGWGKGKYSYPRGLAFATSHNGARIGAGVESGMTEAGLPPRHSLERLGLNFGYPGS